MWGFCFCIVIVTIISMSLAQYRRIIKGSWSNSNEQKRADSQQNEEEVQDNSEQEEIPE